MKTIAVLATLLLCACGGGDDHPDTYSDKSPDGTPSVCTQASPCTQGGAGPAPTTPTSPQP